jgi:16S rRNA processing protein RimM
MEALRPDGSHFGVVHGVDNFGAGDLIEVVADDGRRLSLPFTREAVPSIDLERRRLVVEPPEELIAEVAS